ncbi:MAG: HEAT repeat domain-containing protein [Candidatus Thorarchaeota archaeon]|nr:HEAT repeat domain-containing protein [Candidatus Thorarchaeota archaeon]
MTHPQLRLLSKHYPVEDHTPLHVDVDSTRLWDLVNDEKVHLVLRRPALAELARRHDPDLIDYCEKLLNSEDYEEWLTGISTLSSIGTPEAVDRLILLYAHSLSDERKVVLSAVAKILTAEHVKPFSIMMREIAVPGEIDVTCWTRVAISTLQDVCTRFGIETVIAGQLPLSTENPFSEELCLDDVTLTPER